MPCAMLAARIINHVHLCPQPEHAQYAVFMDKSVNLDTRTQGLLFSMRHLRLRIVRVYYPVSYVLMSNL